METCDQISQKHPPDARTGHSTEGRPGLDAPVPDDDLPTLRTCVNRQQPFGSPQWQRRIAARLGLESTLRPRGRPRQSGPEK